MTEIEGPIIDGVRKLMPYPTTRYYISYLTNTDLWV